MSKRNWKPGDVAMVTYSVMGEPKSELMIRTPYGSEPREVWWGPGGWIGDHTAKSARPVAVIDPEDRWQLERLWAMIRRRGVPLDPDDYGSLKDALRELADPTPEPAECWAVKSAENGTWWVSEESAESGYGLACALSSRPRLVSTSLDRIARAVGIDSGNPPEPQGLGAVVEDRAGQRWILVNQGLRGRVWAPEGYVKTLGGWQQYRNLDVTRVLSEGVTP